MTLSMVTNCKKTRDEDLVPAREERGDELLVHDVLVRTPSEQDLVRTDLPMRGYLMTLCRCMLLNFTVLPPWQNAEQRERDNSASTGGQERW